MPHRACYVPFLLAALSAAACTTLTVEERSAVCRATDWASYGENDGVLGVPAAQRTEKFTDCAALGYPADLDAYQTARAGGLKTYCTVENGYEVGYAGRRYRKVCPPELEPGFLQGYEQGRRERPADYYPYYRFGFGFGYYDYPYFGHHFGHFRHWHHRRRHHRGSQK